MITAPSLRSQLSILSHRIPDAIHNVRALRSFLLLSEVLQREEHSSEVSNVQDGMTGKTPKYFAVQAQPSAKVYVPHFPDTPSILRIIQLITLFPYLNVRQLIPRIYPYHLMLAPLSELNTLSCYDSLGSSSSSFTPVTSNPSILFIEEAICSIMGKTTPAPFYRVIEQLHRNIQSDSQSPFQTATVQIRTTSIASNSGSSQPPSNALTTQVICGPSASSSYFQSLTLPRFHDLLVQMVEDYKVGADICLVGPPSCGKSTLARHFSQGLGLSFVTVQLFADMTCRELLQTRSTDASTGNSIWIDSSLIIAAKSGGVVILDGLERASISTLASLQRLLSDREVQLPDGSILVSPQRYEVMTKHSSAGLLSHRSKIIPTSKHFFVIALASLRTSSASMATIESSSTPFASAAATSSWLTPELLPLFHFHYVTSFTQQEEMDLLSRLFLTSELQPQLSGYDSHHETSAQGTSTSKKDHFGATMQELISFSQLLSQRIMQNTQLTSTVDPAQPTTTETPLQSIAPNLSTTPPFTVASSLSFRQLERIARRVYYAPEAVNFQFIFRYCRSTSEVTQFCFEKLLS